MMSRCCTIGDGPRWQAALRKNYRGQTLGKPAPRIQPIVYQWCQPRREPNLKPKLRTLVSGLSKQFATFCGLCEMRGNAAFNPRGPLVPSFLALEITLLQLNAPTPHFRLLGFRYGSVQMKLPTTSRVYLTSQRLYSLDWPLC